MGEREGEGTRFDFCCSVRLRRMPAPESCAGGSQAVVIGSVLRVSFPSGQDSCLVLTAVVH